MHSVTKDCNRAQLLHKKVLNFDYIEICDNIVETP